MSATSILLVHPRQERITAEIASALRAMDGVELAMADTAADAIEFAADADILMGFGATEALLNAAGRLRWIQSLGSGVDGFIGCASLRPDIAITSAAGFHADPVSEAVLGGMLALARRLPQAFRDQQAHHWGAGMPRLLSASEVLIVGVGQIGAAVGVKCAAFAARVRGISSRTVLPPGFEAIHPYEELLPQLTAADFVVLTAPLSAQTARMIDAEALAAMKASAYLVNAARGGLVDDAALVDALVSGRIAGAALDVFTSEPLPPDSAYWDLPNVIVTPHRSGYFAGYGPAVLDIISKNLHYFRAGKLNSLINRAR